MWNRSDLENQHCRSREIRILLLPALTIASLRLPVGRHRRAAKKDLSETLKGGWSQLIDATL